MFAFGLEKLKICYSKWVKVHSLNYILQLLAEFLGKNGMLENVGFCYAKVSSPHEGDKTRLDISAKPPALFGAKLL